MKDDKDDALEDLFDTTGMLTASDEEGMEAAKLRREQNLAGRKRHGDFNVVFTDLPRDSTEIGAVIWGEMNEDTPLPVRMLIHALVKLTNNLLSALPGSTKTMPGPAPIDRSKMN